jgi:hypothetical protein
MEPTTLDKVKSYFRGKTRELRALADIAICDHPSLSGGHREELQRIFFSDVLPKRYSVGRGMVYGPSKRSREADIVIWDSHNYPSLPLSDHSFFFARSVRCVLESKSRFSEEALKDAIHKSESVKEIFTFPEFGIREELAMLRQDIQSLQTGTPHSGALMVPHTIGTAAVFLQGGQEFGKSYIEPWSHEIHRVWPDLLLFLEPGIVVIKEFGDTSNGYGDPHLDVYYVGDDAMLLFTDALIERITERTDLVGAPLSILQSISYEESFSPTQRHPFSLTTFPPQRRPIWGE